MADAPVTTTETPPVNPPPSKPQSVADDPFMVRLLSDMGKVVTDGELKDAPVPEIKPFNEGQGLMTMGEYARFKSERAALENKPEESHKEDAPENDGTTKTSDTPPTDKKTEEVKDDKPADDPKASEAKAKTEDKPVQPEVKVEKAKPIEEIVEGIVSRFQKPQEGPESTKVKEPTESATIDPDAAYVETLDDSQREALDLARYAATKMPDKYGQLPARTLAYYKKVDHYIEAARKADKDWEPENDEKFRELVEEERPIVPVGEKRKLERQMIADDVRKDLEAQFRPKIEEAERLVRHTELKPELEKAAEGYRTVVAEEFTRDQKSDLSPVIAKAASKGWSQDGWKEASELDPLAAATARKYIDTATDMGREILALSTGLAKQVQYDRALPSNHPNNVTAVRQSEVFQFIADQEAIFSRSGGQMKMRDGKQFATRAELSQMSPSERTKHWAFTPNDVLDMLRIWANDVAKIEFTTEVERRKREGYVKAPPTETAKPPTAKPAETKAQPKETDSPKAKVSQSPGAANPAPGKPPQFGMTEDELKNLWGGGPAMMTR